MAPVEGFVRFILLPVIINLRPRVAIDILRRHRQKIPRETQLNLACRL